MPRLLILATEFLPGPGGIARHAYQTARHLERAGWHVRVVTPQDYATDEEIAAFNGRQPFEILRLNSAASRPKKLLHRSRTVLRSIHLFDPDVLLATGRGAVWTASAVSRPWVAVAHGSELGSGGRVARAATRRAFRRASARVCVSRHTRDRLEALGITDASCVIYNGADETRYRRLHRAEADACRTSFGLPEGRILLTVGRVCRRKGQDVVIRALPRILQNAPDVHYVAAGLPEQTDAFRKTASELGVGERVHFLGRISDDELVKLQNASDVFVMAGRSDDEVEGFGIAVVEAALCGVPAVVSAGSGLTEAIVDGETGLAVPPEDPDATAEAVLRLLCDERRRVDMGRAARRRAASEQTCERQAEKYDGLLREIMRRRSR